MSGGHFSYADTNLKHEMFGWFDKNDKIPNVLEDRELSEMTWDLLELIHVFDYYQYCDEEKYLKAKAEFKKKWFDNREVRVKHVIDTAVDEIRNELYKTYVMENDEE